MVMNVADALSAYKQVGRLSEKSGLASAGDGVQPSGESFADTLQSFATDAVDQLQKGEAAADSLARGTSKADLSSVVTAISNAELMLQTVTTIRDKVIAAYQDITKTAI